MKVKKKQAKKKADCLWDRIVDQEPRAWEMPAARQPSAYDIEGELVITEPGGVVILSQGSDDIEIDKSQAMQLCDKLIELLK